MSTRSRVSVPFLSAVSRPVSSSRETHSPSPPTARPLSASPSRCTTSRWPRPVPVTTSVSPSRVCPSRTSSVVTFAVTPRTTPPPVSAASSPRSSSSTTSVLLTVTPRFWIATPPTSRASSTPSSPSSTPVPVRRRRNSPRPSRPARLAWLSSSPPSPSPWRPSPSSPRSVVSPSVTCARPSLSASSSRSSPPAKDLSPLALTRRRSRSSPRKTTTAGPTSKVKSMSSSLRFPNHGVSFAVHHGLKLRDCLSLAAA
mmetsp:Transcript_49632/g.73810  ORF Transcript_49632/g.73810 Transcript_49632/m.73810 type:complete len:256 (+) Transcript_49632:789-1556(+)